MAQERVGQVRDVPFGLHDGGEPVGQVRFPAGGFLDGVAVSYPGPPPTPTGWPPFGTATSGWAS